MIYECCGTDKRIICYICDLINSNPFSMASIRNLKKDIDYLIFEVISDSFAYSSIHPEDKSDDLSTIITDAVSFRNDLIARVNNPDGKDNPKIVKAYYKAIEKDLIAGVDKLFDRLSSLTAKKG
jgi:hypothetical protein